MNMPTADHPPRSCFYETTETKGSATNTHVEGGRVPYSVQSCLKPYLEFVSMTVANNHVIDVQHVQHAHRTDAGNNMGGAVARRALAAIVQGMCELVILSLEVKPVRQNGA